MRGAALGRTSRWAALLERAARATCGGAAERRTASNHEPGRRALQFAPAQVWRDARAECGRSDDSFDVVVCERAL
eukprot:753935-Pleurochrysis_carterae.AAC.1